MRIELSGKSYLIQGRTYQTASGQGDIIYVLTFKVLKRQETNCFYYVDFISYIKAGTLQLSLITSHIMEPASLYYLGLLLPLPSLSLYFKI